MLRKWIQDRMMMIKKQIQIAKLKKSVLMWLLNSPTNIYSQSNNIDSKLQFYKKKCLLIKKELYLLLMLKIKRNATNTWKRMAKIITSGSKQPTTLNNPKRLIMLVKPSSMKLSITIQRSMLILQIQFLTYINNQIAKRMFMKR